MAYQINLTGKEIDERLKNVGTAEDVAAADGTLYARVKKNADDNDELSDAVGRIGTAQTATNKTVTQHTSDISTLQRAVSNNKTRVENVEKVVNQHTTMLTEHNARQTNIEKVVSGARSEAYFSLRHLNLIVSSKFLANVDNIKVMLYRWSGKSYSGLEMFTENNKGESQKEIQYVIILKQDNKDGANIRTPYIHYNDDATEEPLVDALKSAFGGRISYRKFKKRRWRLQAFLNGRPITAPFDFRVSVDHSGVVSLTKEGMMRSVPKAKEVVYDVFFSSAKWIKCKKGEVINCDYNASEKRFPQPGDFIESNRRGIVVASERNSDGSYKILWTVGRTLYEIGIRGQVIESSFVFYCTYPAKKLCDDIYDYASKMNSGTLRDLYISAGAKYNEATGFYELNGLTDITEEQMRVIYEKTWGWWMALPNLTGFGDSSARTNIPCPDYKRIYYQVNCNFGSSFATTGNLDNLEVLNFIPTQYPKGFSIKLSMRAMNWMCQGNAKPLTIMGDFDVGNVPDNNSLNIGGNVKTINIRNLSKNIRFYNSNVLSKESVLYMINNSAATSAITIGLQQAVYDAMKDDADIIAALAEKTNITLIQNT